MCFCQIQLHCDYIELTIAADMGGYKFQLYNKYLQYSKIKSCMPRKLQYLSKIYTYS